MMVSTDKLEIESEMPANQDVAILVVSCDAYHDLWQPFFHCFFKYWPDCPYSIYLGSNALTYLDPRILPIVVGSDIDYSSNLLSMLHSIEEPWVILWVEDRFLSAPVETDRIYSIVDDAQQNNVGYSKLIASYPYSMNRDQKDTGDIPTGVRYRVCMTVALWRKDVLLNLLRPGETAWEFEKNGSVRSNSLDDKFQALSFVIRNSPPIQDTHIIIKGRLIRAAKDFLRQESLTNLFVSRSIQSIGSVIYVGMYLKINYLSHLLKWNLLK